MSKSEEENQMKVDYYMQLSYSILLNEVEDDGQKYWLAEVPELPGCKSHGSNVEEAVKSLEEAKRDWIQDSLENGEQVPVPVERDRYSGKTLLRMSRSLHRALSLMAETEKISLNQLIVMTLAKEVGKFSVLNPVGHKIDDLLNKVSDLLEEQRSPTTGLAGIWARHYEAGQFYVVDTGPGIQMQAIDVSTSFHGVASTSLSIETPRS
ncbi:MAG: hypothetical protein A2Z28_00155 [Chloroflexi bacterium RBG_16_51_9]|nr:MAG: hypothetical protein A2Z28_00155 [Chloroflexi bacterium RBG_16_51_9]